MNQTVTLHPAQLLYLWQLAWLYQVWQSLVWLQQQSEASAPESKPLQGQKSRHQGNLKEKIPATDCCIKEKAPSVRQSTSSVPIFANGAVTAAFVHLFNHEAGRMKHAAKLRQIRRAKLLSGAQDGHLTKGEADAWYQSGNGSPITVDASRLTLMKMGHRHVVLGINDYAVHGQVAVNPNGTIKPEAYNFEQHGGGFFDDGYLGLRNGATWVGGALVGSGTPFEIHFTGQPHIINAAWFSGAPVFPGTGYY